MVTQTVTSELFEEFILRPENHDKDWELIGGRIVQVVSNNTSSAIAAYILGMIVTFVYARKLGIVTGADGGYMIGDERYIPEVAFVKAEKQKHPNQEAYNPITPDLAIEVLSPSNTAAEMRIKIVNYLQAGVTLWLVDPDNEHIEVYAPNQKPIRLQEGDTLSGGDILPEFVLDVSEIFDI